MAAMIQWHEAFRRDMQPNFHSTGSIVRATRTNKLCDDETQKVKPRHAAFHRLVPGFMRWLAWQNPSLAVVRGPPSPTNRVLPARKSMPSARRVCRGGTLPPQQPRTSESRILVPEAVIQSMARRRGTPSDVQTTSGCVARD